MNVMEFWEWMNKKYVEWRGDGRGTISEFAEYIGVKQSVMSKWMSRNGSLPGTNSLAKIVSKLGPEVYEVLELPRPLAEDVLAELPPEFRDPFLAALKEIRSELVKRGISRATPEAESIIREAFVRHGVNFTFTKN